MEQPVPLRQTEFGFAPGVDRDAPRLPAEDRRAGETAEKPIASTPEPAAELEGPHEALSPGDLRRLLVRRGGSGSPLDHALRERLRPHMSFDPGIARLHQGPVAAEAARRLRAEAFTIGRDVFFGESRYAPQSRQGLGLLAHEVTHVGQQSGIGDRMRFFTPSGGDQMEREAQQTASQVLAQPETGQAAQNTSGLAAHQDNGPAMPSMSFAMPSARGGLGEPAAPSTENAAQGGGGGGAAGGADARVVANRVYDLMKQEIARSRQRGGLLQPKGPR